MQDDKPVPVRDPEPSASRLTQWAKRLDGTKVTVLTVVLFIGGLAVLSFAAAGVGMLAHHLRH
jgi:hypothetical protein